MKVSVKNKINSADDIVVKASIVNSKDNAVKHIKSAIECLGQYCLQNPDETDIPTLKEAIANLSVVLMDIQNGCVE